MSRGKAGEMAPCVLECSWETIVHVIWQAVYFRPLEEPEILEFAELKFQIAAPFLEFIAILTGPLYCWMQVPPFQFVQYLIHVCELM